MPLTLLRTFEFLWTFHRKSYSTTRPAAKDFSCDARRYSLRVVVDSSCMIIGTLLDQSSLEDCNL